MRIWDIDPGFLNNGSLSAEHRELHALIKVADHGRGPATHPEFLRWQPHLGALRQRHKVLCAEMALRGMGHHSPLPQTPICSWPDTFLDLPEAQYGILQQRYDAGQKPSGRIPFPKRDTNLWASHKYSVMARDPNACREIGRTLAQGGFASGELARHLVDWLRRPPTEGRMKDALQHMWGYVSQRQGQEHERWDNLTLLMRIQERAKANGTTYLLHSTALGELAAWM